MDDRLFKKAMGKFATGVTVIVTEVDGSPHGMTANAFMSLSLNPKLVVVSVSEQAKILPKIKKSKKYTVNILSTDQKKYSMIFAGQLKDKGEITFARMNDQPIIPGALANVCCEVVGEHGEGDHTLFIGKVTDIHVQEEGEPLIYYNGGYRKLV